MTTRAKILILIVSLLIGTACSITWYYTAKADELNRLLESVYAGMSRAEVTSLLSTAGFDYSDGYRAISVSERVWLDIWIITISFDDQGLVYDKMLSDADLILF